MRIIVLIWSPLVYILQYWDCFKLKKTVRNLQCKKHYVPSIYNSSVPWTRKEHTQKGGKLFFNHWYFNTTYEFSEL